MILKEFQKFNPIIYNFMISFPSGSEGKYLPAKQQNWVQSLGQEDPLEKEMATHSSTLDWKTPWTEATVHGVAKSWTRLSNLTLTLLAM